MKGEVRLVAVCARKGGGGFLEDCMPQSARLLLCSCPDRRSQVQAGMTFEASDGIRVSEADCGLGQQGRGSTWALPTTGPGRPGPLHTPGNRVISGKSGTALGFHDSTQGFLFLVLPSVKFSTTWPGGDVSPGGVATESVLLTAGL